MPTSASALLSSPDQAASPIEVRLRELLARRILILDGAMGTMIQRYKLTEADYRGERLADFAHDVKGNNELLSITRPQVIAEIHADYLAAGADIIETNTFGATIIAQADYRMPELAREMNLASARIAREAADRFSTPDKPRFVAGALGPQPKTASISPDVNDPGARNVSFEELRAAYVEQTEALIEGGVDILLVETVFDTLNAKAALFAIDECFERLGRRLPIMISGTVTDASGRILSGSDAIRFRKRDIAATESSIASSMLMSMTCAPFSTCWRATCSASSYCSARISRAKAFEPVTLVRSPTFTKSVDSSTLKASRPDRRSAEGRSGTLRGGIASMACAMAAICSGVVPQQPPAMFTKPACANSASSAEVTSGVSSKPVSDIGLGSPAFG